VDDLTTARAVDVLGTSVRLGAPGDLAAAIDLVAGALAAADTSIPPARSIVLRRRDDGRLDLLDDDRIVLPDVEPALAAESLAWRLNAVAAEATGHVVLHAGTVSTPDGGRGVVLPGPSGTGKSTLTAAAVADGWGYLSDEHAALDLATGRAVPLAKPLDLGDRGLVPPEALRPGAAAGHTTAVGAVVFPSWDDGAVLAVEPLAPADALLALWAQTMNAEVVGAAGFAVLAGLADVVPAVHVRYGTTTDALAALVDVVDAASAATPSPLRLEPAVTTTTATVVLADAVVVLDTTSGRTHRLNASAGLIWLNAGAAADPLGDDDAVVAGVRSEAGEEELPTDDVLATLAHLRAVGLLPLPGAPSAR
jgi:hypothetical protein